MGREYLGILCMTPWGYLVIFGRRGLILLFDSSWKNMKNDTTFVGMRNGDHLGKRKNMGKGHLAPSNFTF